MEAEVEGRGFDDGDGDGSGWVGRMGWRAEVMSGMNGGGRLIGCGQGGRRGLLLRSFHICVGILFFWYAYRYAMSCYGCVYCGFLACLAIMEKLHQEIGMKRIVKGIEASVIPYHNSEFLCADASMFGYPASHMQCSFGILVPCGLKGEMLLIVKATSIQARASTSLVTRVRSECLALLEGSHFVEWKETGRYFRIYECSSECWTHPRVCCMLEKISTEVGGGKMRHMSKDGAVRCLFSECIFCYFISEHWGISEYSSALLLKTILSRHLSKSVLLRML